MIELSTRVEGRYLSDYSECVVCGARDDPSGSLRLTEDHLFLRWACRDHSELLRPLQDDRRNLARLCAKDHLLVDRLKVRAYQRRGVVGLIQQLGVYPRSRTPTLLEVQRVQWIDLFRAFSDKVRNLNGHTPPHHLSAYCRAADIAAGFLERWERGNF